MPTIRIDDKDHDKRRDHDHKKRKTRLLITIIVIVILVLLFILFLWWIIKCAIFANSTPCSGKKSSKKADVKNCQFEKIDLVSDIAGLGVHKDEKLVNPWGLARSWTGPWVVANAGSGTASIKQGDGQAVPIECPLSINIPPPVNGCHNEHTSPTGVVFNSETKTRPSEFVIHNGCAAAPSLFLFATEDGTIAGWNPNVDPENAILAVDRSANGAIYKGITIASCGDKRFIYATNFSSGKVEVFDCHFNFVNAFTDPDLAAKCTLGNQGYAPFGISTIDNKLYVTFALQDEEHEDDVPGPGNGFVVVFDGNGTVLQRLISGGQLNAPWGLAVAPECFGKFAGALLVGNFGGCGNINAYCLATGDWIGVLTDCREKPIAISGLWGIAFGNGEQAGCKDHLYFAAGINDENNGLFGYIKVKD